MSRLLDLDGRPLSWETLLDRLEDWWDGRDRYGDPIHEAPFPLSWSSYCSSSHHTLCPGTRHVRGQPRGSVLCECDCHEGAAA